MKCEESTFSIPNVKKEIQFIPTFLRQETLDYEEIFELQQKVDIGNYFFENIEDLPKKLRRKEKSI